MVSSRTAAGNAGSKTYFSLALGTAYEIVQFERFAKRPPLRSNLLTRLSALYCQPSTHRVQIPYLQVPATALQILYLQIFYLRLKGAAMALVGFSQNTVATRALLFPHLAQQTPPEGAS